MLATGRPAWDGQPKTRPGGLMYNPDYAALLERLAEKGVDDFYTGLGQSRFYGSNCNLGVFRTSVHGCRAA